MSRKNRYNNGYVGVDVLDTSTPFSGMVNVNKDYIYSLDTSSNLQGLTATPWTRPADWLSLPTISASEEKFTGLYAIFPGSCGGSGRSADSNFVAFSLGISGSNTNYIVDWGDGTPLQTYASGATAQYRYNFNDVSSTITTEGFKQVVIQAYPAVAGNTMHTVDLSRSYSEPGVSFRAGPIPSNWVDIRLAGNRITTFRTPSQNIPDDTTSNTLTTTGVFFQRAWSLLASFEWIGSAVLDSSSSFSKFFKNCSSLVRVILPPDLTRNISTFQETFLRCSTLEVPPILNTDNATNMARMFAGCSVIKTVPLYNTSKVTSMSGMFGGCGCLTDIPPFNTELVSLFSFMFMRCIRLQYIPMFNYSSATSLENMFYECMNLKTVVFTNSSIVNTMANAFYRCHNLKTVDGLQTQSCQSFSNTFYECYSLSYVPVINCISATDMSSMFYFCTNLKTVELVNTQNCSNFTYMFNGCHSLESAPVMNTSNGTNTLGMFYNCFSLKTVPPYDFSKSINANDMFRNCISLTTLPSFNFSSVSTMSRAFFNCANLKNVGNMTLRASGVYCWEMFNNCLSLETIPLTTQEFSKVNEATWMFLNCSSLKGYYTIDCTYLSTNGSSIRQMFQGCSSLHGITFINSSGVRNINGAFANA